MQDAWLDGIEVDPKLAERISVMKENDDEKQEQDLSSAEIAKIKRHIADVLEPGETVFVPFSSVPNFLSLCLIIYLFICGFQFVCMSCQF